MFISSASIICVVSTRPMWIRERSPFQLQSISQQTSKHATARGTKDFQNKCTLRNTFLFISKGCVERGNFRITKISSRSSCTKCSKAFLFFISLMIRYKLCLILRSSEVRKAVSAFAITFTLATIGHIFKTLFWNYSTATFLMI